MMKKYIYLFLLMAGIAGCQQNKEFDWQSVDAVYFQINSDWNKTTDSVTYSFAGKGVDMDTVWLKVNLQGNMSDDSRKISMVVNPELTTAEEGVHYETLKEYYELPARQTSVKLPLVVFNQDQTLDKKAVLVVLELLPTADLALGISERNKVKVEVSNILNPPSYWNGIQTYFGVYSRVKHEICIRELGWEFPESQDYYDYQEWKVYGKYMSNYFRDHYPVMDENNKPIEPWY